MFLLQFIIKVLRFLFHIKCKIFSQLLWGQKPQYIFNFLYPFQYIRFAPAILLIRVTIFQNWGMYLSQNHHFQQHIIPLPKIQTKIPYSLHWNHCHSKEFHLHFCSQRLVLLLLFNSPISICRKQKPIIIKLLSKDSPLLKGVLSSSNSERIVKFNVILIQCVYLELCPASTWRVNEPFHILYYQLRTHNTRSE